jgi:hypothetical protein
MQGGALGRSLGRAAFLLALVCASASARAQTAFDRPGGDYRHFTLRSGDPAVCAARCDRDQRCRAWSFSYPSGGTRAICWLKNTVPPRTEDTCCVSGVRGGGVIEPRGLTEFGIDRVGGDYRSFEVKPQASGEACAEACKGEARCRAWTYLRPGYAGAAARCFLKSRITRPRLKPCCISGVVR